MVGTSTAAAGITFKAEKVSLVDSIASVFETPEAGSIAALSKNTTSVGEL